MTRAATADLARDYAAGLSLLSLARKYQMSVSAVRYRLERAGVAMRRPGAPRNNTNAQRRLPMHTYDPPPPSPGGGPIPGDEEYED